MIVRSLFLLAGLLAFGAGASAQQLPSFDRVLILGKERAIDDAVLTDQNGEPFHLAALQGRVALVFFGFTNCPDVCPMAMGQMRLFVSEHDVDPEQVAIVMISVDGKRDTPEVLSEFLGYYSDSFIGLTGSAADVKPVARNFGAKFFAANPSPEDGSYTVSHSPQVFVMDQKGHVRAEFYNASVEAMAGVTDALLAEAADIEIDKAK